MLSYSHEHDQNSSFSDQQPDFTIRPADLTPYSQTYDTERQVQYGWLDLADLSANMMEETDLSYRLGAVQYSEKEWSPESIKNVWQHIFSHPVMARHIVDLNRRTSQELAPHILVGGAGTLRDTLLMALLHPKAVVSAYDCNDAMLEQGLHKVNWQYLVSLSQEIWKLNPEVNGFVRVLSKEWEKAHESFENIKELCIQAGVDDELLNNFALQIQEMSKTMVFGFENITSLVKNQISHHLTTHLDFPGAMDLEPQSIDLISDVATLQHVPKSLLDHAIALKLSRLAEGGVYNFDLRIDPEGVVDGETGLPQGRVFYDNELHPDANRYYHTVTDEELELLADRIEKNQLVTDPEIARLLGNARFKVTFGAKNSHPNPNKPAFRDIFVERVR